MTDEHALLDWSIDSNNPQGNIIEIIISNPITPSPRQHRPTDRTRICQAQTPGVTLLRRPNPNGNGGTFHQHILHQYIFDQSVPLRLSKLKINTLIRSVKVKIPKCDIQHDGIPDTTHHDTHPGSINPLE